MLYNLLNTGCSESFDEETNRKIVVINLFALVGTSITFLLSIRAFFAADWELGATLLLASGLFALCRTILIYAKTPRHQLLSAGTLIGCLVLLMAALVITGGNENTGPLWIFIVPPVAMFFGGFVRGIITNVVFILFIAVLVFYNNEALLLTSYSYEFKTRLIYAYLTVTFLSAFYEYSRQKTFETVQQLSEKFAHQALHDPLTSLPNRRGAQQQIDQELARRERSNTPFTVILCDIDHFKSINDEYGHDAGDIVLSAIAELFRKTVRKQDIVSRWGGEEFLFALPDTDFNNGFQLAEKIRRTLADTAIEFKNHSLHVTASFGVCELNEDITLNKALSVADKGMYQAKSQGRNRVAQYQP